MAIIIGIGHLIAGVDKIWGTAGRRRGGVVAGLGRLVVGLSVA